MDHEPCYPPGGASDFRPEAGAHALQCGRLAFQAGFLGQRPVGAELTAACKLPMNGVVRSRWRINLVLADRYPVRRNAPVEARPRSAAEDVSVSAAVRRRTASGEALVAGGVPSITWRGQAMDDHRPRSRW